jgi:hypothetical protein
MRTRKIKLVQHNTTTQGSIIEQNESEEPHLVSKMSK